MGKTSSKKSSSDPADESCPYPPRFYWLKRFSLFGLLFLIALAGLRGWWGHESQRRINALVADAHARGEPILPEDFTSTPIPDSDNAAILYEQAEKSLDSTQPEIDIDLLSPPYSTADLQVMAAVTAGHQSELQLLRAARERHQAHWSDSNPQPTARISSAHRSIFPRLATLLNYAANYEHSRGEDAEAIELLRDILAYGNAEAGFAPRIWSPLVAGGIESTGTECIIEIGATLEIDHPGTRRKNGATEQQIRSLIDDLLDESRFHGNQERAWMGERSIAIGGYRGEDPPMVYTSGFGRLIWPILDLEAHHNALAGNWIVVASRQDNFPAAMAALPPVENFAGSSFLGVIARRDPLSYSYGHIEYLLAKGYELSTKRRVAAILLAIRLFQTDHAGRFPRTLDELAPAYLAAVPLDPFAPDHHPLHYLPDRDPPAIYSVGYNGTDEGGSSKQRLVSSGKDPWEAEDAVCPVGVASSATQPTGPLKTTP